MLVAEPAADVRLKRLSPEGLSEWLALIGRCDLLHSDIVDGHELAEIDPAVVDEWDEAGLVERLPFGTLRMLALKSVWVLDHAA